MDKVFPEPARLGLTQGRNSFSHTSPDMKEQEARGGWQGKGREQEVQQEGQGGNEPRAERPHPSPTDIRPPAAPQGEEIPPGAGMDTRQGVPQAVLLRGRIPGYRQEY